MSSSLRHRRPTARVLLGVLALGLPPLVGVGAATGPVGAVPPVDGSHQGDTTTVIEVGGVDMVVHTFTTVGSTTFTPPLGVSAIDYLVVAGGGGGAGRYGGGGGGGGVLVGDDVAVTPGAAMAVTVGAGGNGGIAALATGPSVSGSNGADSVLGSVVAKGGGGGGNRAVGKDGGSGGGGGGLSTYNTTVAGGTGTAGQGYAGGVGQSATAVVFNDFPNLASGGGGGAGGVGGAAGSRAAGIGGAGLSSDITGTAVMYGGGGGGGAFYGLSPNTAGAGTDGGGDGTANDTTAGAGAANRGGGGGGGGLFKQGDPGGSGGAGGSGIVVVRYAVSSTTTSLAASANPAARGDMVTLTASVTPADATGVVTISDGADVLGTCEMTRLAPGECDVQTDALTVGTHTLTAAYAGSTAYTGSNSGDESLVIERASSDVQVTGFGRPIDMGGVLNTAKAGSTIPLKFAITDVGVVVSDLSYVEEFEVDRVSCAALSDVTDPVEFTTTGGTTLRYDTVAQQFVQNWKLPTMRGACYRVRVHVLDAVTPLTAYVMAR